MKKIAFVIASVALLVILNFMVFKMLSQIAGSRTIFLELAAYDPRSLMQGDYMRFNYAIFREMPGIEPESAQPQGPPPHGAIVVKLDEKNIARFSRFHHEEPLAKNEVMIKYRMQKSVTWGSPMYIAPETYFIQEGHAKKYNTARYAEIVVDKEGSTNLVSLRGPNLEKLGN